MQRYCVVLNVKPERLADYRDIHACVWPSVLKRIADSQIRNYTIFLRQPENLLIGYYEYYGTDHAADLAAIANDPVTQRWWQLCEPMQLPLPSCAEGEWWAPTESIFQLEEQLEK